MGCRNAGLAVTHWTRST